MVISQTKSLSRTGLYSDDHRLVDRIVYLGSLASDKHTVDPMLDALRVITANWHSEAPLDAKDRMTLTILEGKLKDYLIHEDPLRSFTAETLEVRLKKERSKLVVRINSDMRDFILILLLTAGSGGAVFASPLGSNSLRLLIAFPIALLTLHFGIVWFYFSSLHNFNRQFREAFEYLCGGVILFGMQAAMLMVVQALELTKYLSIIQVRRLRDNWIILL